MAECLCGAQMPAGVNPRYSSHFRVLLPCAAEQAQLGQSALMAQKVGSEERFDSCKRGEGHRNPCRTLHWNLGVIVSVLLEPIL